MIIDAHQHVWDLSRAAYPWLDGELAPIDRTMELSEVTTAMHRAGVGATVLVQAADNAQDTENMLLVADAHPEVVGIVAWVPLDEPEQAAATLQRLRRDSRVVGVRTLLHAQPDPEWVLRDDVDEGLGVLEAAGVSFDYVTGTPDALRLLPTISARHPELRIVIDHLAKPPVGGTAAQHRDWRRLIAAAAENPRVAAKISGLYAATGALSEWSIDSIRPFVDDALQLFGAERLMVGGDWPISVLAGGYERTWTALTSLAGRLDPTSREALLGGTAAAVYRLDPSRIAAAALHARPS